VVQVFGQIWNQTDPNRRPKTGLLADSLDQLLILHHFVFCKDGRVVDEKERDGDEDENNVEDTSGYEDSGV
jgi:hypothetical protein